VRAVYRLATDVRVPYLSHEPHLWWLEWVFDWEFYFYLVFPILIRRVRRSYKGADQVRHIIADSPYRDMAFRIFVDVLDLLRDTSSLVLG